MTRSQVYVGMCLCVGVILVFVLSSPHSIGNILHDRIKEVRAHYSNDSRLLFEVGSAYLNSSATYSYNLSRARGYLKKAALANPQEPFVYHELARISFLEGDMASALTYINLQISNSGTSSPSSYYVRGLIEGFMGKYEDAAKDYEIFLRSHPTNWAGINDYAWVLLKDRRPLDALVAVDWGLIYWPENTWLHNSRSVALYEMGRYDEAYEAAMSAKVSATNISESTWLKAYPGNDPLFAPLGIQATQKAVEDNIHRITLMREDALKNVR